MITITISWLESRGSVLRAGLHQFSPSGFEEIGLDTAIHIYKPIVQGLEKRQTCNQYEGFSLPIYHEIFAFLLP